VIVGPGILVFLALVVFLTGGIFFISIMRIRVARSEERRPAVVIFFGILLSYALLAVFNFTLPTFFENTRYIPYGAAFILPIIIFTSYAILRHKIFNVRVFATGFITAVLAILTFFEVIFAQTPQLFFIKSVIFGFVLVFGVLLIRVVQKEIEQREEIRKLADELAVTNVQLETSNERLRIMDQRKSEFVSIASHQLRTPVTAMKGYSSLLLEDAYGKLPDSMRDPVQKIFDSTQRLVNMISDFLNVSKIEQGTMAYTFAPLDIKKMVVDLVEDFHVVAGAKKLDLATDIPEGMNFYVVADEGKIRQILSNLIDNSIKYTPKGSVRVMLEKEPNKGDHGMIHLMIRDTGIGLSQDDIHHLFGKFTRGAEGSKVNTTGSGLGLYVAKQMMEKHQGNIWVDSEGKGKGSTFSIELPEFHGELPKA
jgi:signal transduction histidine kinase